MVLYRPLGNSVEHVFQGLIVLDGSGVSILVDAGWDSSFSRKSLDKIVAAIPQIDAILLTHATVGHTGAFCYLRHKYPDFRAIPTYATLPVIRMSQMMTLDTYRTMGLCGAFDSEDAMSSAEVEQIWSEVHNVKYSQPLHLHFSAKVEGTVITAFNAGHSLGGSIWKISDGIDSIVAAFDWNHARDAHLSGAFLEPKTGTVVSDLQKPSLLLTSTTVNSGLPLTKARQQFLDYLEAALAKGGTVLIPTSSGSRVLELMLVLDKQAKKLQVPLVYCSYHGKQTMMQASSMLEWMVPSIISDWQLQNESPFNTKKVNYATDVHELREKWPQKNKIVLADGETLEAGPSKEIFLDMIANDADSSVLLSEVCPAKSLGHRLLSSASEDGLTQLSTSIASTMLITHEPLQGDDLTAYNEKREEALRSAVEEVEQLRRNKVLIDASAAEEGAELSADEEEEEEEQVTDGPAVLLTGTVHDFQCDESRPANQMFPFVVKKRKFDDYGLVVPAGMLTVKKPKTKPETNDAPETMDEEMQDAERELDFEPVEQPMRVVATKRTRIKVRCWFANADMNGLTNLRSLQMILKQVQPAKIIALPGNTSVVEYLKEAYPVFALANKDVTFKRTDYSVDVRLDPKMKLKWRALYGGYAVARVTGKLEFDPHDKIKRSTATLLAPTPEDLQQHLEETALKKITIGDLKLMSLRKVLSEAGIKGDFRGQNTLVCNDKVILRKTDDGHYLLDGGIDEDYYIVRSTLRKFITSI